MESSFTPEQWAALERKEQQMDVLKQPSVWNETEQLWEASPRQSWNDFVAEAHTHDPPPSEIER